MHGTGRALDVMIPTIGGDADNTTGDAVGAWLLTNAEFIGIQLVIWDKSVWQANLSGEKLRPYGGPITHVNHLHVELTKAAGEREETPFFHNGSPGTGMTSDGALLREPSGSMAVIAGGAPFAFASIAELDDAGYASKPYVDVPTGYLATLPTVPTDGALVRNATTGEIRVIAGGAAPVFTSWAEYVAAGYGQAAYVNVPPRDIAALRGAPVDRTLVRNGATGEIRVFAGTTGFSFASVAELDAAGYQGVAYVNVPASYLASLPTRPADGALLRNPSTGEIRVIAGGAGFSFASVAELVAAGYNGVPYVDVPPRYVTALPTVPADRTLVRNGATGEIRVIAGGAGISFASWADLVAGYGAQPFVNIPPRYLDVLPTSPSNGTLLRAIGSSTIWRITNGMRAAYGSPPGAVIVDVPASALAAIPLLGLVVPPERQADLTER